MKLGIGIRPQALADGGVSLEQISSWAKC